MRTLDPTMTDSRPLNLRRLDAPIFKVPYSSSKMSRRAFAYRGSRAWNDLSTDIRNTDNYFKFKTALGNLPEFKTPSV